MVNAVAPAPKEPEWVKQSPRAFGGGFKVGKNSSVKKKEPESRAAMRPASAKNSSAKKTPFYKPKPSQNFKGLAIQGEEIRPVVNRLDGRRKASELIDSENARLANGKNQVDVSRQDSNSKVNEKVKNIYNLKESKSSDPSILNDANNKPVSIPKPVEKRPVWVKSGSEKAVLPPSVRSPVVEEIKSVENEVKAKEKINKYRQSILKFLDSDNDEPDMNDGLETNHEVSDDGERDDDNILDGTAKSIRPKDLEEEEKDLNLDDTDEVNIEEPVLIEGSPYFKTTEAPEIEPLHKIIKNIIIERFGVENSEKGIDFVKAKSNSIYNQTNFSGVVEEFKRK